MPHLSEIRPYSREATVAAVSDYFDFLATMYVKRSTSSRHQKEGGPRSPRMGSKTGAKRTKSSCYSLIWSLPVTSVFTLVQAGFTSISGLATFAF